MISDDTKTAYFVLDCVRGENGAFIPLIAIAGQEGYHQTDWLWDYDYDKAMAHCEKKNSKMGVTPDEAAAIIGEALMNDDEFNSVDTIASGYEWTCNCCGTVHKENEWNEKVECVNCEKVFFANQPDHAISD